MIIIMFHYYNIQILKFCESQKKTQKNKHTTEKEAHQKEFK